MDRTSEKMMKNDRKWVGSVLSGLKTCMVPRNGQKRVLKV